MADHYAAVVVIVVVIVVDVAVVVAVVIAAAAASAELTSSRPGLSICMHLPLHRLGSLYPYVISVLYFTLPRLGSCANRRHGSLGIGGSGVVG